MNPMKKILCGLLALVLFCTMVTWPAKPAEAATKIGYISTREDLFLHIFGAEDGATLDLYLKDTDVVNFDEAILIRRPITINFHPQEGKSSGLFRSTNSMNRIFSIDANNVTLNFDNITLTSSKDSGGLVWGGGAIGIFGPQNVTIKGATFETCEADKTGGAIVIENDSFYHSYPSNNTKIEDCIFRNCYSRDEGGAIHDLGKNTSIRGCKFYNCKSKKEGGAIYIGGDENYSVVEDCHFEDCESTGNDAGAIFVAGKNVTIKDCYFKGCKAPSSLGDGGAIKLSWLVGARDLRVENCRFIDCSAARDGKWIDSGNSTTILHCTRPYLGEYYYKCKYADYDTPSCRPEYLTKITGVEATCTSPGLKTYYECWCGLYYSEPTPSIRTLIGSGPGTFNPQGYLEVWKRTPGMGYLPAKGHDFEEISDGNTISARCKNDPEHSASIALAVKNTVYSDNTKNAEISGNIDRSDWAKYGYDYDFYYMNGSERLNVAPVNAGSYRAVVDIKKNGIVQKKLVKPFTIDKKTITAEFTSLTNGPSIRYSGQTITNNVVVKDGGKTLKEGTDYTVSGDFSGKEKGEYTITVRGMGNYTGTAEEKWYIVDNVLKIVSLPTPDSITYGDTLGTSYLRGGQVNSETASNIPGTFTWEAPSTKPEVVDSNITEYTIEFIPNDIGLGVVEGKLRVTVNPKDLSGISLDRITVPSEYTGEDLNDYIKVDLDGLPGLDLVKGADYGVITEPTIVREPGKYKATINFIGNYSGTVTKEFAITRTVGPEDIDLTVPAYSGEVLNDSITVLLDRKEIKRGTDYDIRFSPAEVKERGEYTAFITLKGDYIKGKVEIKFSVDGEKRGPRPAPSPTPTPSPSPSPSPDDGGGYSGGGYSGGSSGGSLSIPAVTTQNGTANKPNTEEPYEEIDLLELLYAHPDAGKALPLIRMYNPVSGEHIMTTDANEADTLEAKHGWKREAMTGTSSKANDSPVFRLVHPATGKHIYSMNENEVRVLTTEQGWESDGIVFFAGGSNVKMYRLYNPSLPAAIAHHYTTDEVEYNTLQSQGWTGEGVAFTLD